jgi:hypothetical protein
MTVHFRAGLQTTCMATKTARKPDQPVRQGKTGNLSDFSINTDFIDMNICKQTFHDQRTIENCLPMHGNV